MWKIRSRSKSNWRSDRAHSCTTVRVAVQIDELQKTDAVHAVGLYEAYLTDWEDAVRQVRGKNRWGVGRGGGRK